MHTHRGGEKGIVHQILIIGFLSPSVSLLSFSLSDHLQGDLIHFPSDDLHVFSLPDRRLLVLRGTRTIISLFHSASCVGFRSSLICCNNFWSSEGIKQAHIIIIIILLLSSSFSSSSGHYMTIWGAWVTHIESTHSLSHVSQPETERKSEGRVMNEWAIGRQTSFPVPSQVKSVNYEVQDWEGNVFDSTCGLYFCVARVSVKHSNKRNNSRATKKIIAVTHEDREEDETRTRRDTSASTRREGKSIIKRLQQNGKKKRTDTPRP